MAKMTAADITAITAQVEEIEKNGGKPYALWCDRPAILRMGEFADSSPWLPAQQTYLGVGTLEGIISIIEELVTPFIDPFCELVTNGTRASGEKLYAAPEVPLTEDVYMAWRGCPYEAITAPRTVWYDFEDDDLDPWGKLDEATAEPVAVTRKNVKKYARYALQQDYGTAKLVPARKFIARLAKDLGVSTEALS